MSSVKYFVVQPFLPQFERFHYCDPIEAESEAAALSKAKQAAAEWGGAIAFSRAGNIDTGEFQEAVILGRFGQTPAEQILRELD